MEIEYEKQTLDHPNPIARFAHRTRFSSSKRIVFEFLQENSLLVDYGCGQGRFLSDISVELKKRKKKCFLYGYDPFMKSKFDGYEIISDVNLLIDGTVSMITCLEVCEHLDEFETSEFVNFSVKKLVSGGILLVTVPIMMGPAILLKELSQSLLFRRMPDISCVSLLLSALFGITPPRAKDIKVSHRGYDWQVTLQILQKKFLKKKVYFSPIKFLGWYGNSQAIMVFQKK